MLGTLLVGVFADKRLAAAIGTDAPALRDGLALGGGFGQLGSQALGAAAVALVAVGAALAVWLLLKLALGIRVSREEELRGLDIGEHGMEAYAGFQTFTNT